MMTNTARCTFIVIGTAAYLAPAIMGGGGLATYFSHPALIVLAVVLGILAGASFFAGGNLSTGVREDRGNRWVLAAFAVVGLLGAYLPAYTDRKEFWTIDGDTVRWIGVVLFAAGGALRLWPVFVLGDRFSGLVAIQPGHRLVTGGVYGLIRHPSYPEVGRIASASGRSQANVARDQDVCAKTQACQPAQDGGADQGAG
jgi:protein-S-isoprenylcysteine O-methyltransferase Ste14